VSRIHRADRANRAGLTPKRRRPNGTTARVTTSARHHAGIASGQSLRPAGTVPPFFASSRITALCSQMFISADPSVAPV